MKYFQQYLLIELRQTKMKYQLLLLTPKKEELQDFLDIVLNVSS